MKSKITGIIAVFLAVFLIREVNAYQVYKGSFYEAEKIEGVYFYKHREDTPTTSYEYHNFHSQATIYRKSSSNKFVYCIESWAPFPRDKVGTHKIFDQRFPENWDIDQVVRVEALAYYGYGYKENGYDHTNPIWYAVTQYLIWETISKDIEHYFVSSLTSSTPIYPFEKEIEELNRLVDEHTSAPIIENYTKFQKIEVGKKTILKDLKGIFGHYERIESPTLDVERISNNEVAITAKSEGIKDLLLYHDFAYYNDYLLFYSSNDYQDMLEPGNLFLRTEVFGFEAVNPKEETDDGKEEIELPSPPDVEVQLPPDIEVPSSPDIEVTPPPEENTPPENNGDDKDIENPLPTIPDENVTDGSEGDKSDEEEEIDKTPLPDTETTPPTDDYNPPETNPENPIVPDQVPDNGGDDKKDECEEDEKNTDLNPKPVVPEEDDNDKNNTDEEDKKDNEDEDNNQGPTDSEPEGMPTIPDEVITPEVPNDKIDEDVQIPEQKPGISDESNKYDVLDTDTNIENPESDDIVKKLDNPDKIVVEVPATDDFSLSLIFYTLSIVCLLFLRHAK